MQGIGMLGMFAYNRHIWGVGVIFCLDESSIFSTALRQIWSKYLQLQNVCKIVPGSGHPLKQFGEIGG